MTLGISSNLLLSELLLCREGCPGTLPFGSPHRKFTHGSLLFEAEGKCSLQSGRGDNETQGGVDFSYLMRLCWFSRSPSAHNIHGMSDLQQCEASGSPSGVSDITNVISSLKLYKKRVISSKYSLLEKRMCNPFRLKDISFALLY